MMPRGTPSGDRRTLAVGLAVVALALAVYAPVRHHEFVRFDDDGYLTQNARVRAGLSWEGVRWAFRSFEESNWHPLSWLSHMADVSLWGMDAGAHHLVSLALHAASAALLFAVLHALTGALWRSALVAALFAAHPLHVESVAWASERKDVLSTLFLWLALGAWVGWVRRRGAWRYLAALAAFALGLAAKPMIVTLPALLLLLDRWPLGRAGWRLREKLPFLALALGSGIVTLVAQGGGGSVASLERFPPTARVANALASYLRYAVKALFPADLAVFYPFPQGGPGLGPALAGAAFVAGMSWLAWRQRRSRPALAVGWAWFAVGLLPVIGLVQVGEQALADRYLYAPLVGLALIPAWGVPRPPRARCRALAAVAALAVVAALASAARLQVGVWRDSETLFRHALAVNGPGASLQNSLGAVLLDKGRVAEALALHREAVRARPANPRYRHNLGLALERSEAWAEAETEYRRVIATAPGYEPVRLALGTLLLGSERGAEAIGHYREARRLRPDDPLAAYNLGCGLVERGALREAEAEFRSAISLRPGYAEAHNNLGATLMQLGSHEEALVHVEAALRLDPGNARAHFNRGDLLQRQGRDVEAAAAFREAVRLDPAFRAARARLARLGG